MECAVCIRDWNSSDCIPKMLSCGHSFCETCLNDIFKTRANSRGMAEIPCPNCSMVHRFKDQGELLKLTKNFALISLAEAQQFVGTQPQSKKPAEDAPQTRSSVIVSDDARKLESSDEEEMEPALCYKQACKTHNG